MTDDIPTSGLEISLLENEQHRTLGARGEVDLMTAADLTEALSRAIDGGGALLVDLTEVSFIDSTGLRALLGARERARDRGVQLAIEYADSGPVHRLLDLAGVLELFPRGAPPGSPK